MLLLYYFQALRYFCAALRNLFAPLNSHTVSEGDPFSSNHPTITEYFILYFKGLFYFFFTHIMGPSKTLFISLYRVLYSKHIALCAAENKI